MFILYFDIELIYPKTHTTNDAISAFLMFLGVPKLTFEYRRDGFTELWVKIWAVDPFDPV